ncbi:MAG: hypothetical protein JWM68_452 [Verrucomicrobiales bacterium]|nr:hypothetical protein [Verrucomicrobiales bacterium]
MQENSDKNLLRQFAENHSEEAFATLVARYVNLVYSVALRHVDSPHQAEEVTQAVWIILAKKAHGLRHLESLSSWLFETSRLTAANFMRSEIRRTHREQEVYMQSLSHESESAAWAEISPLLDTAVAGLKEKDRRAVMLRFYEGKTLQDVGDALGTSEDAAFQRVNRAVEKLRQFFTRRGVAFSAAVLVATISANSVQAAPVGLTPSVVGAALNGSALTSSTLSAVKATLTMMKWAKLKIGFSIGVAVLLAAGAVTVAVSNHDPSVPQILQQVEKKYASLSSYSETATTTVETALPATSKGRGGKSSSTNTTKLARPNLYRIEELSRPDWFALWSVGDGNYWMMLNSSFYRTNDAKIGSDLLYTVPLCVVPSAFFEKTETNPLRAMMASADLAREKDEKVGSIDCYTFSGSPRITGSPPCKLTLWIGKKDFLVHKLHLISAVTGSRVSYTNFVTQTHENISVNWAFTKEDFIHDVPADAKVFDSFPGPGNSK